MKHSISELLRYISVRNIRNSVLHFKQNSRPIYCLLRPSVSPTSHLTLTTRSKTPRTNLHAPRYDKLQWRQPKAHLRTASCASRLQKHCCSVNTVLKTTAACQSLFTYNVECTGQQLTLYRQKSESAFRSNAPGLPQEHCFLEGPQA